MAVHGISQCFQDDFLTFIEDRFKDVKEQKALVDDGKSVDTRRSVVKMERDQTIQNHLWTFVSDINVEHYGYDIWNHALLQYTVYHGTDAGYYDWHADTRFDGSEKSVRKMSLTIQLSDSDEYTGGDFQAEGIKLSPDLRAKGSLIMFPSWLPHRVTPVTSGIRKSLVAWFVGPMWR